MFELELLGKHCANPPDHGLDAERELFRTGRRLDATVVDRRSKMWVGLRTHENQQFTLQLDADGTQYETQVWAHGECAPSKADMIQIAVSPDGSQVALDTDERYFGPPGRSLVWTAGHEKPDYSVFEAATAQVNERLQAQLDHIDAMHAAGQIPDQTYAQVKANILRAMGLTATPDAPAAPVVANPEAQPAQLAVLEDMHAKGTLTDEEFELAKTRMLGG